MLSTYLLGWDLNTNLLDCLCELIRFYGSVVVEVEVLEGLLEDCLLGLCALGFLGELVFEFSLETILTGSERS